MWLSRGGVVRCLYQEQQAEHKRPSRAQREATAGASSGSVSASGIVSSEWFFSWRRWANLGRCGQCLSSSFSSLDFLLFFAFPLLGNGLSRG